MACGRLLRDEESKRLRIGPHCLKRLQARLAPRSRRVIGTPTAVTHPDAVPARGADQLAFEIWDDEDDDPDPYRPRAITDVPTGALL
ncbi:MULTISPECIES: DUF6011 domain-containing protein [unclassified Streptomyces]|uniref:DUF6011 domain-containing protein n=1 Tax=unclassified Streptomyces TaxID=2593676 RepID=UPI0036E0B402